jgi:hypothetical protein
VLCLFLPVLKLLFFGLLCLLPAHADDSKPPIIDESSSRRLAALVPSSATGSALAAIIISAGLGLLATCLSTSFLGEYGWSLFVGLPFVMGFTSVLIYSFGRARRLGACILTAIFTILLAGAGLLAAAMEGFICLLMAAPLALAMGILGGITGYLVQRARWPRTDSTRLFCAAILAVPLVMTLENSVPPPLPLLKVQSSIVVNAPPETVWQNVVAFAQLPPPHELIFRLGVAYPIRAEIRGRGVGAVRYCNFSTGPFVEPIEVWDEPRLLKFSVTQNPEPMQEWTFYRDVHPAHLDGYLQSCGGQFRLVPLAGDRTLLEGTTWYYHRLWPADYWRWWSDYIIHTIHFRVLNHVKELSEKVER